MAYVVIAEYRHHSKILGVFDTEEKASQFIYETPDNENVIGYSIARYVIQ